jgi:hypothetical protein
MNSTESWSSFNIKRINPSQGQYPKLHATLIALPLHPRPAIDEPVIKTTPRASCGQMGYPPCHELPMANFNIARLKFNPAKPL